MKTVILLVMAILVLCDLEFVMGRPKEGGDDDELINHSCVTRGK